MSRFTYLAMRATGEEIRGFLDGPNADWVSDRLVSDELIPLEIEVAVEQKGALEMLRENLPVGVDDLSLFSSQFALMLDTGLPILTALELLAENATKLKLRRALLDCADQIRQGSSLTEAMSQTGQFPGIYLNMIRAAETSGTLVEVLQQLASYLDREAELRGRIKGALVYPAFLIVLSLVVVTFLMVAIIPRFTGVLVDMKVPLPLPTKILMTLSALLVAYWPWLLAALAGAAVTVFFLLRDEAIRLKLDGLALALPLIGEMVAKNSLARMSFVLGSLLAGGIPIVDALDVAGGTVGNRHVQQSLADARRRIIQGSGISEAMSQSGTMPSLVLQMVSIGEATGNLDRVLLRVSDLYDQQVARVTDSLVRLVEPALIVVLGVVVGFIALSLVLPMVKAVASFGG
jgi:type IV pilus assembly protein PilC